MRIKLMPKFYLGEIVNTPDGEGVIVDLGMYWNGLFISEETATATVWYSTDEAKNGWVSKEYPLSSLPKVLPDLEAAEKAIPKWISVNERLPEKSGLVLITVEPCADQYIAFYKHSQNLFQVWGVGRKPIKDMKTTHWMPLPPPPPAEG